MLRNTFLAVVSCGLLVSSLMAQTREEKVRNDKQKVEAAGYWIYNDVATAFDLAKKSGQPIMAVLRCIPCEECVKLDDEIIDADERLKPLLEKFVRVRIVSTNGLNLSLFRFDTDQSFAVFFLNAEGTVYGHFGTRSHRKDWLGDVSVDGLAKAMRGALALHAENPKNQTELLAKRGPAPAFASPELFPTLKDKYKATLDYQGKVVQSCIHCHQVGEAIRDLAITRKEPLNDKLLFPFPHPKTVGLVFDPQEMARVLRVEPGSAAAQAGFRAGDDILKLASQPLLSIADVQWVLDMADPDGAELVADVARAGQPTQLTLKLAKGWRQRDNVSWRASTWALRRRALGGAFLVDLPEESRKKWNLSGETMALLVEHVGQYAPHDVAHRAGLRKGDVVVSFDERTDLLRETDVLAYTLRAKQPGVKVSWSILRNGAKQTLAISLPE